MSVMNEVKAEPVSPHASRCRWERCQSVRCIWSVRTKEILSPPVSCRPPMPVPWVRPKAQTLKTKNQTLPHKKAPFPERFTLVRPVAALSLPPALSSETLYRYPPAFPTECHQWQRWPCPELGQTPKPSNLNPQP